MRRFSVARSKMSIRRSPALRVVDAVPVCAESRPLPEFRHYRPRPRDLPWAQLDARAVTQARELLPGLAAPAGRREQLRRRTRSLRSSMRNFIVNRRLARRGREDFRPLYFVWTLLRTCNFRCDYCDDHQGRRYPELDNRGVLDTHDARRVLDIMRTRATSVYFAGGEPLLRKDLPQITRHAVACDYYPIIVNTNGSMVARRLADPAWRTWLADTDIVVVSLDALDPIVLADMWKTRDPEVVIQNVLLLRHVAVAQRVKLMVNCVVQPGRVQHALDVLDWCNDLGIWFSPVPCNVVAGVDPGLADDPLYETFVARVLERKQLGYPITGSRRLNERLLRSAPLSCRNTLKPHVDYDGKLWWPCKSSRNVEPVAVPVLDFDHVDQLYEHARRIVEPSRFHGQARNQCGGQCNWAQNYSTDAYAHGLRHPWSLAREVLGLLRAA